MILGVLSDTHSLILSPKLLDGLKKTDLIIHAGDLVDGDVLKALKALGKPIKAVQGNMDDPALKKKLPLKEVFEIEGVKVGLTHGHIGTKKAFLNAQDIFKDDEVNLVIFGHSHQPQNEKVGNVHYFNPGSPNDACRAPYFSFGQIELKDGKIKAEIIKL
jgi:uncharacterized protein